MARDLRLSAELEISKIQRQIRALEAKPVKLFAGDAKNLEKFRNNIKF